MATRDYWAVHIGGAPVDLAYWAQEFIAPSDPWVQSAGDGENASYLLRSAATSNLTNAEEVRGQGTVLLNFLNGVMRLSRGAEPVRILGVWEVMIDGTKHITMFADAAVFLRGVSAVGLTGARTTPTDAQRWAKVATVDDQIADMLKHFSAGADWIELYKAFECVRRLAGGDAGLASKPWAGSRIDDFTHTANYYHRHARNPAWQPPKSPMTLADASALVRALVHGTLNERV